MEKLRMAEAKNKKKRTLKKRQPESIREQTKKNTKARAEQNKPRTLKKVTNKVSSAKQKATTTAKREYYLPVPEGKVGSWLNKRRSLIPQFIKNSWKELRQVTWPTRSETVKLTISVLVFAIAFGSLIAGVDYVLDIVFRRVILNL